MDFQVTWVTCHFMVMAMSKDGLSKRGVGGDVDTAFVCEDPFGILPVRQMRTEGRGDGSIHRLQCLEDKRVRGQGGLDTMGEGHVNEVNKERGWKKGDSFILKGSRREQVRAVKEGIRFYKLGSWNMDHCEVEIY